LDYDKPFHVRWDVDFRGKAGRTKRIARQIREASPRVVEIWIEGEKGLGELPAIFTEMHKCGSRIEATLRLFPGAESAAQRGYAVDFIWDVDPRAPFRGRLPHGARAISVAIDEDSLVHFPDLLEEFTGSGLGELRLPNVNAVRSLAEIGHVPLPQPGKLEEAAEAASRLPVQLGTKRLVVHDYFFWTHLRRVLPAASRDRIEFSECLAASGQAYVDWDGNVYPCESLPIRLGNLQDRTFEKIWATPGRLQILETVRAVPGACGPCDQSPGCLSVCRGLLRGDPGSPDAAQRPGPERPKAAGG
jgi:radical SAM protein with 4Fe4S-binding SPASM domain